MAVTKYAYSISQDFTGLVSPYTRPDIGRLTQEIQTSAIVTALDHIDCGGDACDIYFKDAISSGDETILDGIVAAHTGAPLAQSLQVQPVKIEDTNGLDPLTANTQLRGYKFTAAGKDAPEDDGKWTNHDFSFPFGVDLLMGEGRSPLTFACQAECRPPN